MNRITHISLVLVCASSVLPAIANGQQAQEDETFFEKPPEVTDKREEAVGEGTAFPPSESSCLPLIRQPGETDAEFRARQEDHQKRCEEPHEE